MEEEWTNGSEETGGSGVAPSFIIAIQSGWYSFIFTLGFIGNLYVILTVQLRTLRKSATNVFIVNLAVSDLLVLLLCLPQSYITDYFSWPFGKLGCRLLFPLSEVFFTVSILTLTVITIERHRAIVHPFKSKCGPKLAKGVLVFVWIVSYLVVGLPLTFIIDLAESEPGSYHCQMHWPSTAYRQFHTIFIALVVMVPLLIIAYSYAMIISTMRKQSRRIKKRNSNTSSIGSASSYLYDMHKLDENKKLVKLLVLLVVVFWICMTPLVIMALVLEFTTIDYSDPKTMKLIEGFFTFAVALFFTNSAFNPVAIYIMSSEVRKGFYEVRLSLSGCGR